MFSIFVRVKINVKNCLNFFIVRESYVSFQLKKVYEDITKLCNFKFISIDRNHYFYFRVGLLNDNS